MFPDSVYPCDSYQVPSGCQLLLYSDGAFELPAQGPARAQRPEPIGEVIKGPAGSGCQFGAHSDEFRTGPGLPRRAFDDCALVLLTFP